MIILNCPAICNIGKFVIAGYEDKGFCTKYKQNCEKINGCIMKLIADKLNCFWCDIVGKSYDEEERQAYINQKIADIFDLFDMDEE